MSAVRPNLSMPKRVIWELLLILAGLFYVLMALWDNLESLPFAVVFVALAAQELVHVHRGKHRCRHEAPRSDGAFVEKRTR